MRNQNLAVPSALVGDYANEDGDEVTQLNSPALFSTPIKRGKEKPRGNGEGLINGVTTNRNRIRFQPTTDSKRWGNIRMTMILYLPPSFFRERRGGRGEVEVTHLEEGRYTHTLNPYLTTEIKYERINISPNGIIPTPKDRRSWGCRTGSRTQKKKKRTGLGSIINLSQTVLTHKETNILNQGLKCGMKRPLNRFDVFIDIHRYIRKLNIKKYFLGCAPQVHTTITTEDPVKPVDSG